MISIRNATNEDYSFVEEQLVNLHNLHALNEPTQYRKIDSFTSYDDYLIKINSKDEAWLVAVINNIPVGLCFGSITTRKESKFVYGKRIFWLEGIIIADDYKRQGIAADLFKNLKELFAEKKVDDLELMVWNFNEEAVLFYDKYMKVRTSTYTLPI